MWNKIQQIYYHLLKYFGYSSAQGNLDRKREEELANLIGRKIEIEEILRPSNFQFEIKGMCIVRFDEAGKKDICRENYTNKACQELADSLGGTAKPIIPNGKCPK